MEPRNTTDKFIRVYILPSFNIQRARHSGRGSAEERPGIQDSGHQQPGKRTQERNEEKYHYSGRACWRVQHAHALLLRRGLQRPIALQRRRCDVTTPCHNCGAAKLATNILKGGTVGCLNKLSLRGDRRREYAMGQAIRSFPCESRKIIHLSSLSKCQR